MKTTAYACLLACLCFSGSASAHHSTLGFFESDRIVEIEGTLVSLSMSNPHVRYVVQVTDESGQTVDWNVETSAVSVLRTRGLDQDFMHAGDHIRVSGHPSRRGRPELSGQTILLDDGTEVITALGAAPYFTDPQNGRLLKPVYTAGAEENARKNANGIFRVWSTVLTDPEAFPLFKKYTYPLTEAAQQAKAAWNPRDPALLRCWRKGMPLLMITPVPIEFVPAGDDIVIRFEEDDAQRLIHMNAGNESRPDSGSLLGYSMGHWEGNTLVVETTDIDFPYLDDRGTPQSKDVHLLERFTLNAAEDRLDYRITITDPANFTEPFDLTRYFVWRPEIVVGRWDCQESQ